MTYNLAKTPLKAAQAPLATAKNIHCDRRLQLLSEGIFEDGWFLAGEGSVPEAAAAVVCRLRIMVVGGFGVSKVGENGKGPLVVMMMN
jgi:hypothetical protein